jgi:hypothetical protein
VDRGVEVLDDRLPGLPAPAGDDVVELGLQGVERGVDLVGGPAALVDLGDGALEVDAGGGGRAQHVVAGAEHPLEQLQLLREQLVDPDVSLVRGVEEVDHDHVGLLAVAVAPADALLDALRVPRQIVVHHHRAEL